MKEEVTIDERNMLNQKDGEESKALTGKGKPEQTKANHTKNPLNSMSTKLFIIFFCCITALVFVVGIFSYNQSKQIIQRQVTDASKQTISQLGAKLELAMGFYEDESLKVMTDAEISRYVADGKNDQLSEYDRLTGRQSLLKKLNAITLGKMGINRVHILSLKDEVPYSSAGSFNTGGADNGYKQQAWFQKAIDANGKLVWLPTKLDGYSGENGNNSPPMLGIARVLTISNSDRDQILLFEIPIKAFEKYLNGVSLGEMATLSIVNENNDYIYSEKVENLAMKANFTLSPEDRNNSLDTAQSTYETINDQEHLVIYKKLAESDWTVISTVPVAELTKDTKAISDFVWLSVGAAIIIAILVGLLVARMIGRPLRILRNLMKEGEKGDLTVRTKFKGKDEIGEVGRSFNQMMDQMSGLIKETTLSAAEVLSTAEELLASSKHTTTSAREIAAATEEIANGSSSLAVEAEKGNHLTHTIGERMQEAVLANNQMGETAADVQRASEQGTRYMSELSEKTSSTEQMTRSMVTKVEELKESTSSIRKILDVLNNMTKQTNILSLNATIEAARAGTAGKGFMVVADEIRKLAEQTKQNIGMVAGITDKIQREMDETVIILSEAYPLFKEQIQSVREAEVIFAQVNSNMTGFVQQLSDVTASIQVLESGQQELTEAMSNVSAVSEESSATSEEVASLSNEQLGVSEGLMRLAENLERLSKSLQESLSHFRV